MSPLPYAEALLTQGYCFVPVQDIRALGMAKHITQTALREFAALPLKTRVQFSFCFDRSEWADLGDELQGEQSDDGYLLRDPNINPMDDNKHAWHQRSDLREQFRAVGVEFLPVVDALMTHAESLRALLYQNFMPVTDQLDRHPALKGYSIGNLVSADPRLSVLRLLRYMAASPRQGEQNVVGGFHDDRSMFTVHAGSTSGMVQANHGDPFSEADWHDVVRPKDTLLIFNSKKAALLTGGTSRKVELSTGVIELIDGGLLPTLTHRGRNDPGQNLSMDPRLATVLFIHNNHVTLK
jgi:hypothetical protein